MFYYSFRFSFILLIIKIIFCVNLTKDNQFIWVHSDLSFFPSFDFALCLFSKVYEAGKEIPQFHFYSVEMHFDIHFSENIKVLQNEH